MSLSHPATSSKLSAFFHSIRFRLSVYFVLALAVIMAGFSAFVYVRQSQEAYERASILLGLRMRDLDQAFHRTYRDYGAKDWLGVPGTGRYSLFTLEEDEIIVLAQPDGEVALHLGPIQADQAAFLASSATENETGQFFTTEILNDGNENKYVLSSTAVQSENGILGWVTLGEPVDPDDQLPRLLLTLIAGGFLTLLAALAGGYWLADRTLKPVKAITRTAQEINEKDLNRRLNIHSDDELGQLAGTFDQMLDRLQAAFTRQRQFTADASHELRTPLTIVNLETNRVLSSADLTKESRRSMQVIQSENEFMARLVNELLTLARMDAGQIHLQFEEVDLSDLALEVAERFAPLAVQKKIRLEVGELPETNVQGDRHHLTQMIGNLVENAIKYSPDGSQHWVRIETGSDDQANPPSVWLRVSDNGPGIAPEHLSRLFDRFYRVDTARSHNPSEGEADGDIPGSGLGLSIVQWIAQKHGGEVTVQSQPDHGTIFEVRLPAA
jgi:heavy metal sensor kinase